MIILKALVLGIVEGVTEFLPVSSTGHLILASAVVDYPEAARATFEIFIQLGAILAVVWHFRAHLLDLVARAPSDGAGARADRQGAAGLRAGGGGRLPVPSRDRGASVQSAVRRRHVDRWRRHHHRGRAPRLALHVHTPSSRRAGCRRAGWAWRRSCRCFPGVSRAGATIIGGMFAGLDRPAATQFSFYLSIPTLFAASLYSLFKARHDLVVQRRRCHSPSASSPRSSRR